MNGTVMQPFAAEGRSAFGCIFCLHGITFYHGRTVSRCTCAPERFFEGTYGVGPRRSTVSAACWRSRARRDCCCAVRFLACHFGLYA